MKRNSTSFELEFNFKHSVEPCDVANEFSKYFQSVYNNPRPVIFSTLPVMQSERIYEFHNNRNDVSA
jgi:hypothetical protein